MVLVMLYKTRQRDAIWNVIRESTLPLTAAAICEKASKKVAGLGIATVYRALKQFIDEGQVRYIDIVGSPPHYETSAKRHHHFFLCEQCKRVFDMMGCLRGIPNLLPDGYRMKRHEIIIYGDCPDCASR